MTVWKFRLQMSGHPQALSIPGGKPLAFQFQDGEPTVWWLVDATMHAEQRIVRIVGTGHDEVQRTWRYIGTAQQPPYVWHLFEVL